MSPSQKFHQALPLVLLPVSPSLAALHASRARRHHPYTTYTCPKCGRHLDSGSSHRRFLSHKHTTVLRTLCYACGGVQLVPVGEKPKSISTHASPSPAPSSLQHSPSAHSHPTDHSPVSLSSQKPTTQSTSLKPKARPKKKSGLQELLSRNREREKEQSRNQDGKGLAAFLGGL